MDSPTAVTRLLRPVQRKFAERFVLNGGNALDAYRAVRPKVTATGKHTKVDAYRERWRPEVAAEIERLASFQRAAHEVLAVQIEATLLEIMLDGGATRFERIKAAELLARTAGLLIQRTEHSGPGGGPIPLLSAVAQLTVEQVRMLVAGQGSGRAAEPLGEPA